MNNSLRYSKVMYNPWGMGKKGVVQPMTHEQEKCCTTHGSWGFYIVVQRCMAHGSWNLVMMYSLWVMGKKSLNGVYNHTSDQHMADPASGLFSASIGSLMSVTQHSGWYRETGYQTSVQHS